MDRWDHGYLYAISPEPDPLAHPPEPYLCINTSAGQRFLYAPHLADHGDGPHDITNTDEQLALDLGFGLFPDSILSLWTQRDTALISIARAEGILPAEPGPLADAEQVLRHATPAGRITSSLHTSETWPNSTAYISNDAHGLFRSLTVILRTTNPYQARSLLIMLGADHEDIAHVTGIQA